MEKIRRIFYRKRFEREWKQICETARGICDSPERAMARPNVRNTWGMACSILNVVTYDGRVSVDTQRALTSRVRQILARAQRDLRERHEIALRHRGIALAVLLQDRRWERLTDEQASSFHRAWDAMADLLQEIYDISDSYEEFALEKEKIINAASRVADDLESDLLRIEYMAREEEREKLQQRRVLLLQRYNDNLQIVNRLSGIRSGAHIAELDSVFFWCREIDRHLEYLWRYAEQYNTTTGIIAKEPNPWGAEAENKTGNSSFLNLVMLEKNELPTRASCLSCAKKDECSCFACGKKDLTKCATCKRCHG